MAAVAGSASWFISDVASDDLWWNLAAGREFFAQGRVPRVDTLSFTANGRPWLNPQWLWGVLAFALYDHSPTHLALAQITLLAITFALVFETARRTSGSAGAAVLACWLAASCTTFFSDIRPHSVTLFFTAFLLATRHWRHAPWLWPFVIAIWCNLHAGFIFGLGMIGLLVVTRRMVAAPHQAAPSRGHVWHWLSLLLCVLALCANPWGHRLLDIVATSVPSAKRSLYDSKIVEWQPLWVRANELWFFGPLSFWSSFHGRYVALGVLATIAALELFARDPFLVLLGVTSACMALRAQRFVELSAIVLAPLAAAAITRLMAAVLPRPPRITRWLMPAVLALVALLLWRDARFFPDPFGRWTGRDRAPRAAVHYLRAFNVPLRVLNLETWGGYIGLHAPQLKVFFDGRAQTVYDAALPRDYGALLQARKATLPGLLENYQPDAVLMPHNYLVEALRDLRKPWTIAYEDQLAVVLLPADSPLWKGTVPDPEKALANEPQWLRRKAVSAYRAGNSADAQHWLQRALVLEPLFTVGYVELMNMLAQRGGIRAAQEVASKAWTLMPEQRRTLLQRLGAVCEQHGEVRRAADLYRAAIVIGPFDDQLALRGHVAELEATLR